MPLGPELTIRALRTTRLFRMRTLPLRVGCDTTCSLTITGTIAQRSKPARGHRRAVVRLRTLKLKIPAGETRIVRLPLSAAKVHQLRRALRGRHGLTATIQLTASAGAGDLTDVTKRLQASG